MTTMINMELDADTVGIYTAAPPEDQSRLCVLWGILVREYQAAPMSLGKLMDEIGSRAQECGLTQDELDSILHAC